MPSCIGEKHGYVAEYGKSLLELLPVADGASVLDIGCGTGELTSRLAERFARVVGIDGSENMVAMASQTYPGIDFQVMNAFDLPWQEEFDCVFSNAVFHWLADHPRLLRRVFAALRPGGMLVCEFGAEKNIRNIEKAFAAALIRQGREYRTPFNFPSASGFRQLLQDCGFIVTRAEAYERPPRWRQGSRGLVIACARLRTINQESHIQLNLNTANIETWLQNRQFRYGEKLTSALVVALYFEPSFISSRMSVG